MKIKRIVEQYIKIIEYDYTKLGDIYADTEFITPKNSIRKRLYEEIYNPIIKSRNFISKSELDFKDFSDGKIDNYRSIALYIRYCQNKLIKAKVLPQKRKIRYYRNFKNKTMLELNRLLNDLYNDDVIDIDDFREEIALEIDIKNN